MATHSSILAQRIPWTEEPGGLLSIGSHRVEQDWSDLACTHALEKEMATHSSILAWRIPGMGSWWAAVYGVAQSWTWLQWLSTSSNSQGLTHYVLSECLCDGISHMYSKSNPSSGNVFYLLVVCGEIFFHIDKNYLGIFTRICWLV